MGSGDGCNFEVLGDRVDHRNFKGDLLHLSSSLSEGSIFLGGVGGLGARRVTFEETTGMEEFKKAFQSN